LRPDGRGDFDSGGLEHFSGHACKGGAEMIPLLTLAHFDLGDDQLLETADDVGPGAARQGAAGQGLPQQFHELVNVSASGQM